VAATPAVAVAVERLAGVAADFAAGGALFAGAGLLGGLVLVTVLEA
jgi:hypothetical protein